MTDDFDSQYELRSAAEAYRESGMDLTDLTPAEIKYIRSNPDMGNMIVLGQLADMVVGYEDAELSERQEIEAICPGFAKLVKEVKSELIEVMLDFQSDSLFRQIKAPFKLKGISNRTTKISAKWLED